jgi:hypothetical protein
MRITGTGGFGPTFELQTFTTTVVNANDRLLRLQYRRVAEGEARMTITATHLNSGQVREVQITLQISAP